MIVREWTGSVSRYCADEYQSYLRARLEAERRLAGNRATMLLRRSLPQSVEFQTLTFWDNLDAVRVFAGEDCSVVTYGDELLLSRKPKCASHFTVLMSDLTDVPRK